MAKEKVGIGTTQSPTKPSSFQYYVEHEDAFLFAYNLFEWIKEKESFVIDINT